MSFYRDIYVANAELKRVYTLMLINFLVSFLIFKHFFHIMFYHGCYFNTKKNYIISNRNLLLIST